MTAHSARFRELNVLRGIAASLVVLFHYWTRYGQLYVPDNPPLLGFEFPDGIYGVYLFFMISGFVIFMTLRQCARLRRSDSARGLWCGGASPLCLNRRRDVADRPAISYFPAQNSVFEGGGGAGTGKR
jgi:hypothetical protein